MATTWSRAAAGTVSPPRPEDLLHRQHLPRELDHAVARWRLRLQEHRRAPRPCATARCGIRRAVRSPAVPADRTPVRSVASAGRRGTPPDARPGRRRCAGSRSRRLLAVPARRVLADGAQRQAVLRRQVIEPRILLMQPLHRHRSAVGPAVAALRRLFGGGDLRVRRIEEPHQAFALARRLRGVRAGLSAAEERVQALQRALPRLAGSG